ncbi:HK97-gp10 family putative phage morphogenesis protein [Undibacterium curvum]|uniref:HK97 gp10 family phage protein n=1 Tax=Undibacterium curvum TaxID=2762294 RepID=A0ABR7A4Z3_9BURK|nr:HK97-gp10 family putative phage morphogenesis protein [Undibacterium curvum]MBC3931980.1 HK97 gp10 family phage protein [Undibacterium curvum]
MADITGLDALQLTLTKMAQGVQSELPSIVSRAADEVVAEIEPRMPERTGALKAALEHDEVAGRRSATSVVQVDSSAQGGGIHYAIFKEFGTALQPAEPFFRPGVDAAAVKVKQVIADGVVNAMVAHGGE